MRPTLGPRTIRTLVSGAPRIGLLFAALLAAAPVARAESPHCTDLRAQIARAGQEGMAARYRAAAAKQRAEYGRLALKGRSMGCDRQQFLFFGEAPPPQCGGLNARLSALQGSIAAYESAATDDSQRQALMARYEVECRPQRRAPAEPDPGSFFEELFGVRPPDQTTGLREEPVEPPEGETEETDSHGMGGPMAICVRSCDGGFFPITYTARRSRLEDLDAICKAMCPGAEARLYTQSQWKGLDSAVSIEGEPYSDHPNAHKFETSYDPACGCKPPGQSWTEALAEAERILAERNKKDQMVTAEQAEQLSRPQPGARSRAPLAPATASVPAPEATGGVTLGPPEVFRDVVGPDGVKRRVRVVAPTL